ncbi:MAG: D-alanine--D-alanine ligase family protein [Alphaproteobacteria bacterium]
MSIDRPIRVGFIFGGTSAEHEVSLASTKSILENIDPSRIQGTLFGISKDGNWLIGPGAWWQLYMQTDSAMLPFKIRNLPPPSVASPVETFSGFPSAEHFAGVDCLFPITHGSHGEDGILQGFLSMTHKPVVGCGVLPSAIAYDKAATKRIVRSADVPVVKDLIVSAQEAKESLVEVCNHITSSFGHNNLFVKPVCGGSSIGASRVKTFDELGDALQLAFKHDGSALVEQYIDQIELMVGVVGNGKNLIVSPSAMSQPRSDSFDSYDDKYILETVPPIICPSAIPRDIELQVQDMAKKVYQAIECRGFARIDFFLDRGTSQLYLNEVNTIPGFTASSVFPMLMKEAGLEYTELLNHIINLAVTPESAFAMPARPSEQGGKISLVKKDMT